MNSQRPIFYVFYRILLTLLNQQIQQQKQLLHYCFLFFLLPAHCIEPCCFTTKRSTPNIRSFCQIIKLNAWPNAHTHTHKRPSTFALYHSKEAENFIKAHRQTEIGFRRRRFCCRRLQKNSPTCGIGAQKRLLVVRRSVQNAECVVLCSSELLLWQLQCMLYLGCLLNVMNVYSKERWVYCNTFEDLSRRHVLVSNVVYESVFRGMQVS